MASMKRSDDALVSASDKDRAVLVAAGYSVRLKRERDFIVEVTVSDGCDSTDIQWVQDSAYRFFPLIEDEFEKITVGGITTCLQKKRYAT